MERKEGGEEGGISFYGDLVWWTIGETSGIH
jgi:hypothetical protein